MRILFIQPNVSENMVGFTSLVRPEPLALEMVAASVPEHEVKILDLRVDPSLEATLASFRPDLVGLTGYTTAVPRMLEICAEVKTFDSAIVTVVGGYHATLCPQDFDRDFVDVIVIGEGEITFSELVRVLEAKDDLAQVEGIIYRRQGRQLTTRQRALVANLDSLPLPARHLVDHYRHHYHFHFWDNPYLVETSRGCPYNCTFCAVWIFHRRHCRFRSPERVLEDLKTVKSDVVCFVDDNFLQSFRRVEHLHELVEASGLNMRFWMQARSDSIAKRPDIIKKWAELGLMSVLIGLEKFREEELASVNKRNTIKTNERAIQIMKENNIDIWGAFIVDPQWTEADFDAMIDYVRSRGISFPSFTILTPLPGTHFFREKFCDLVTMNYELFDLLHSVLPTKLPLDEFYANMARLYASTTLGFRELKQRVREGQIPFSALDRVRELLKDVTNPEAYLRKGRRV
ncbi:MAG: cobalamin B12-binding domain-containing protein [Chloroflexi bacterium]|nr:cobalamin B12-binding domain-containing protein [Chloroflexota bacterium]